MRRLVPLLLAAVASLAAVPARALPPVPWDGTEPKEFTHYVDHNGDGRCDDLDRRRGADQLRKASNGIYPDCEIGGGKMQVAHGHWEYAHEHRNPEDHGRDTEEKDYADLDLADPSGWPGALDEAYRFVNNEPIRAMRFLRPESMRYWEVDEFLGPRVGADRVPLFSWTDRYFECASPCTADGASGGFWTDQFATVVPMQCHARRARTDQCGMKG